MSQAAQEPNIATVRALLKEAFTPEGLERFCLDHEELRPIAGFSSGQDLDDRVAEIIDYCRTHLLWNDLLAAMKEANPRQYARFEPKLHQAEPPVALAPKESPAAPQEPEVAREPQEGLATEEEPPPQAEPPLSEEPGPETEEEGPGDAKALPGGGSAFLRDWLSLLIAVVSGVISWLLKDDVVIAGVGWAVAAVAGVVWWAQMLKKIPIPPILPAARSRRLSIRFPVLRPWLARMGMILLLLGILAVAGLWGRSLCYDAQPYLAPQFEIAALDTLEGDPNAYELTDMLIWNQDNLDRGRVAITFTLEVRPSYFGRKRYGQVVARISGDGKPLEDKPLWDDFDRESGSAQLHLSLPDLLQASGLRTNTDPATNPFASGEAPFQQARLTVQVVQAANPTEPLASGEITIRNAPWVLRSERVWRNGQNQIDVYVENLGGTGEFTVRYHLVRLEREIGSDSHPVTSGTRTVETWYSPQPLVRLEPGGFFTDTLVLAEVNGLGRYLLETYVFKKQNYVRFQDPGATWEDLESLETPWWFGRTPADLHVFLKAHGTSIETLPFRAIGWNEAEQPAERGWVQLSVTHEADDTRSYRLDFGMPMTATAYSAGGLAFSFEEPVDLWDYAYLEVDITFGSEEMQCSLDMRDRSEAIDSVTIGPGVSYPLDIEVTPTGNRHQIRVPLAVYFGEIDRQFVQDMGVGVNAADVQGDHYFVVHDIRFFEE